MPTSESHRVNRSGLPVLARRHTSDRSNGWCQDIGGPTRSVTKATDQALPTQMG